MTFMVDSILMMMNLTITDEDACNYDSDATDEDCTGCETCSWETDGTGTADFDDGDGVCDDLKLVV